MMRWQKHFQHRWFGWAGLLTLMVLLAAPGVAQAQMVMQFEGFWFNNMFMSTDSAFATTTVTGPTVSVSIDLDGFVFGEPEPMGGRPPLVLTGMFNMDGSINFDPVLGHPTYGDLTDGTLSPLGMILGTMTNVPNPRIDTVDLTGAVTPTTIDIDYVVNFAAAFGGGSADGFIDLDKVPEPCTASLLGIGSLLVLARRRKR